MRPFVKSYGDNSNVTLSPAKTRMRLRRKRPARCARTTRSCSSCTLKSPLGKFSNTVPVTSMLSSLLIYLHSEMGGPASRGPARDCQLRRCNVGGLQTLRSLRHFELHLGAFVQRAVSLRLNGGEVYEDIFPVLPLDKAVPLGCVKPLHCSFFFHLPIFPL